MLDIISIQDTIHRDICNLFDCPYKDNRLLCHGLVTKRTNSYVLYLRDSIIYSYTTCKNSYSKYINKLTVQLGNSCKVFL